MKVTRYEFRTRGLRSYSGSVRDSEGASLSIEFKGWTKIKGYAFFATTNKEIAEALLKHPNCNKYFYLHGQSDYDVKTQPVSSVEVIREAPGDGKKNNPVEEKGTTGGTKSSKAPDKPEQPAEDVNEPEVPEDSKEGAEESTEVSDETASTEVDVQDDINLVSDAKAYLIDKGIPQSKLPNKVAVLAEAKNVNVRFPKLEK